jgi:hypothetical protein
LTPGEPDAELVAGPLGRQYEGDTLVIDTVGLKAAPLSTVDPVSPPYTKTLHVVERYRLIDGGLAAAGPVLPLTA